MRERDIIASLLAPLATCNGSDGLLNDAACLSVPYQHQMVVTTDMLVEGVHFLSAADPYVIACKALGANLSDLAAMGAVPHSYQLAVSLSPACDTVWLQAFCQGLKDMQTQHCISLSGGDTTYTPYPYITISITAYGTVPQGQALSRTGANIGDDIYVTGSLGDAAIGLHLLQHKPDFPETLSALATQRYWHPSPRLQEGVALRGVASACMDISDGLLTDCRKLCAASHTGAAIAFDALPLSPVGQYVKAHHPSLYADCVSAGDDYELLFTIPPHCPAPDMSCDVTRIGHMTDSREVRLLDAQGNIVELSHTGYEHSL